MNKKFNPSLPSGFRDYNPKQVYEKNWIISQITKTFELYGFSPIETSSIEKREVLNQKYGNEADKLIFNILNSGDFFKKNDQNILNNRESKKLVEFISDKCLRYDLTIPLSRYLVNYPQTYIVPFKRYQIQKVWRADRPQKGRLREFTQCDIDIVGKKSIISEAEVLKIIYLVFQKLNIENYQIHINNRKILNGICKTCELEKNLPEIAKELDKYDKIGEEKVINNLYKLSYDVKKIQKFIDIIFNQHKTNNDNLLYIESIFNNFNINKEGLHELDEIIKTSQIFGVNSEVLKFDLTLCRGLDYYTGTVVEIKLPNHKSIGSIGAGGRYDELLSDFGLKDISAFGFSFGFERIYQILKDEIKLPKFNYTKTQILILNFYKHAIKDIIKISETLRLMNIFTDIFPYSESLKKQLNYANKRSIPYVIIIGEKESKEKKFILKNMISGEQFVNLQKDVNKLEQILI